MTQPISTSTRPSPPAIAQGNSHGAIPVEQAPAFTRAAPDGGRLAAFARQAASFVRHGHADPATSRLFGEKQQIARDVPIVETKCNEKFPGKSGSAFFAHNGSNATITKNVDGSYRITGRVEYEPKSPLFDLCLHHGEIRSANIQNTGQRASNTAIQSLLVDANYALSSSHLLGKKPWPNAPFK